MDTLISVMVLVKNNIQKIRCERNISISELARLSGISKSDLDSIELGFVTPRLTTAIKICKALNLKIEDVFPY